MDQRQQLASGSGITILSCFEDARHIAHALQSKAGTISDNLKQLREGSRWISRIATMGSMTNSVVGGARLPTSHPFDKISARVDAHPTRSTPYLLQSRAVETLRDIGRRGIAEGK